MGAAGSLGLGPKERAKCGAGSAQDPVPVESQVVFEVGTSSAPRHDSVVAFVPLIAANGVLGNYGCHWFAGRRLVVDDLRHYPFVGI